MIISGTVRNAVKLAQLDNKWQQKKAEGNILKKDMDPQTRQINKYKEDLAKMRESNKMSEITTKIKSGSELTPEELDYLKKNNPSAYKDYLEIQQEKENYEKELKSCKTKDEVEELRVTRLGQFAAEAKQIKNNPYIPEAKKVQLMGKILAKTMGIEKVHLEYVKSLAYQNLPTDEELAEEKENGMEKAAPSAESTRQIEPSKEDAEEAQTVPADGDSAEGGTEFLIKEPDGKSGNGKSATAGADKPEIAARESVGKMKNKVSKKL